jgi:hypothetical protein
VIETGGEPAPSVRAGPGPTCDTAGMTTPPKATELSTGKGPDTGKSKTAAQRNSTRNTNRKANTNFAKELKDSLATGQPTAIAVAEENNDLKGAWHAAAKEVAYKLLDLTKESWKDYSVFEKSVVHNELNAQFKFDPPIDAKRIDNFLSSHLRTSRAVWKAHWKKCGPSERHHNCPQGAWDKLCKWWPTAACQEQAAVMASRRARVARHSEVGRSSLLDRMDDHVSNQTSNFFSHFCALDAYVVSICDELDGGGCSNGRRDCVSEQNVHVRSARWYWDTRFCTHSINQHK